MAPQTDTVRLLGQMLIACLFRRRGRPHSKERKPPNSTGCSMIRPQSVRRLANVACRFFDNGGNLDRMRFVD